MINYNINYRGAFEYDKFVLNVLQFKNESNLLIRKCFDEESKLMKMKNDVDLLYSKSMQENLSLSLHYKLLRLEN